MTHSASLPTTSGLVDSSNCGQSTGHTGSDVILRLLFAGHSGFRAAERTRRAAKPFSRSRNSVVQEQRDQQDDRQRHAKQPQQRTSREVHGLSSSMMAS